MRNTQNSQTLMVHFHILFLSLLDLDLLFVLFLDFQWTNQRESCVKTSWIPFCCSRLKISNVVKRKCWMWTYAWAKCVRRIERLKRGWWTVHLIHFETRLFQAYTSTRGVRRAHEIKIYEKWNKNHYYCGVHNVMICCASDWIIMIYEMKR